MNLDLLPDVLRSPAGALVAFAVVVASVLIVGVLAETDLLPRWRAAGERCAAAAGRLRTRRRTRPVPSWAREPDRGRHRRGGGQ